MRPHGPGVRLLGLRDGPPTNQSYLSYLYHSYRFHLKDLVPLALVNRYTRGLAQAKRYLGSASRLTNG